MKLKSAHIFLAAASLATLTVLAGCGTNNSNELSSPGYNVADLVSQPQIVSLTLSPATATTHVGQTIPVNANASLSNGTTAVVNSQVTWTSSDPSIASVSATGVVSSNLPGTVTITATRGTVTANMQYTVSPFITRIFTSNSTGTTISVFDLNATGAVTPVRTITGLSGANQMIVSGQELFVANTGAGEVDVYYLQAEGAATPLRRIKSTAFTAPTGIAINNGELFVLSGTSISVFNTSDNGLTVSPKRAPITGAVNTGLVSTANGQLSVTDTEIIVPNLLDVRTFPKNATGDVAPSRILTGPAALLVKATSVAVSNGNIFVSDPGAAVPSVYQWPVAAATTTAPTFTFTEPGGMLGPVGLLPVTATGNLWVTDTSSVRLYNSASVLQRSFTSASLGTPSGIVITGSF
ncbi:hypothetical protein ABS71_02595 [bacterium SCN 62-11]|nr:Ig-like domain-containing protein [Candidatus Eremiobacteraeota bacterium]ODT77374.1 MAG: hypothetical protein ABS71_02595 [bacterium SCN 62-11]